MIVKTKCLKIKVEQSPSIVKTEIKIAPIFMISRSKTPSTPQRANSNNLAESNSTPKRSNIKFPN